MARTAHHVTNFVLETIDGVRHEPEEGDIGEEIPIRILFTALFVITT